MSADLPHWHAGFTAIIDVENATVQARGTLEVFTVELLRGAIANLALHHPARITIDLSAVVDPSPFVLRILDDWQRNGIPGSTIPIDLAASGPRAAKHISLGAAKPPNASDCPRNTLNFDATRPQHDRRRDAPDRGLTLAHNTRHEANQAIGPQDITIADTTTTSVRTRKCTA